MRRKLTNVFKMTEAGEKGNPPKKVRYMEPSTHDDGKMGTFSKDAQQMMLKMKNYNRDFFLAAKPFLNAIDPIVDDITDEEWDASPRREQEYKKVTDSFEKFLKDLDAFWED